MQNSNSLFDLTGKVALVTGAAQGLGRAFADAMAEAGANVVCVDIQGEKNEETAQRIEARGSQALAVEANIGEENEIKNAISKTVQSFGGLDILINNAVNVGVTGPVHEYPLDIWNNVLKVALTGVFLCSKHALKVMIPKRYGKIINIASVAGMVGVSGPSPMVPAYVAAKGGVVNLSREMAMEYAPFGINVNCIAPGVFETDGSAAVFAANPDLRAAVENSLPLRRGIGRAQDLKGTAIYLASKSSDYMTGHILAVDQGFLAQ